MRPDPSRGFVCLFASLFLAVCLLTTAPLAADEPQNPVPTKERQRLAGEPGITDRLPSRGSPLATGHSTESVPRLIKFTGTLSDSGGNPRAGVVGITFALYDQQTGGAPLWLETQNVEADVEGRYTVLLGATKAEGIPVELFSSGEARWLAIEPSDAQGWLEAGNTSRVLLVSVPYALKASDAETLGGRPASDYVLRENLATAVADGVRESQEVTVRADGTVDAQIDGSGTTGFLAKFVTATSVGDSVLFESSGNLGVGTLTPLAKLHVVGGLMAGTGSFSGNTTNNILAVAQTGAGGALVASTLGTMAIHGVAEGVDGTGIFGEATSTTGTNFGIRGRTNSAQGVGLFGEALAVTGNTTGVQGLNKSSAGTGVLGAADSTSGSTVGVAGIVQSPDGTAGVFISTDTGGALLRGFSGGNPGTQVFSVDGSGNVRANSYLDLQGNPIVGGSGASTSTTNTFTAQQIFTALPSSTTVDSGSIFINPASATTGQTLFGVALGGTERLRLNAEGVLDVTGGIRLPNNISIAGNSGNNIGFLDIARYGLSNELVLGHGNANFINFTTGGTVKLHIANSNLIGMGTTSPTNNLHVVTATEGGGLSLQGSSSASPGLIFFEGATSRSSIGQALQAGSWSTSATAGDLVIRVADQDLIFATESAGAFPAKMIIQPGGNVGIGTTTPSTKLDVAGTVRATAFVGDGSGLTNVGGGASTSSPNTFTALQTFTATPTGTTVDTGSLLINPASATFGQTLLGVAVGGIEKLRLNEAGSLTLSGTLLLPDTTNSTTGVIALGGSRFIHAFGINNTFVGAFAGNFTMTGFGGNTTVGFAALASNTSGAFNSAFGLDALGSNTTGQTNSAFGFQALGSNTGGLGNSAFGTSALFSNITGQNNAAFGSQALSLITVGLQNSAFGFSALLNLSSGDGNTAIGRLAGQNLTTGSDNIYIGNLGVSSESGIIRIGTSGTHTDTFLAGTVTATAFVGDGTGLTGLTGAATGSANTFTALQTFTALPTGTTVGTGSLLINPASASADQTLFGVAVGGTEKVRVTSEGNVNLSGVLALPATAAGGTAGVITLGGSRFLHNFANNTFLGINAGNFSMTGAGNTATGFQALTSNTTGSQNTATGSFALVNNTTGPANTAVGQQVLQSNNVGGDNTAIGLGALFANTSGNNNTALGSQAGLTANSSNANTTGSNNTFVGFQAGPGTSTQLTNATAIGSNAAVNCSNCLVLGDSSVNVGIGTSSPTSKLHVVGTVNATAFVGDGSLLTGLAGAQTGTTNTFTALQTFSAGALLSPLGAADQIDQFNSAALDLVASSFDGATVNDFWRWQAVGVDHTAFQGGTARLTFQSGAGPVNTILTLNHLNGLSTSLPITTSDILTASTLVVGGDTSFASAPRMFLTAPLIGQFGSVSSPGPSWTVAQVTLERAIVVTRITVTAKTPGTSCTNDPRVRVTDGTNNADLLLPLDTTNPVTGTFSQGFSAGATLSVAINPISTDGTGCSTQNPADAVVMVHYRMQ